jgi:hypothetical protein
MTFQVHNMESKWRKADGPGVVHIVEINQAPFDTFAVVSLTKAGEGGGYCGIMRCNGTDLSPKYPPAHFRSQMTNISIGIVSPTKPGAYAEGMITLFRET